MSQDSEIRVEVVFALAERQVLLDLLVPAGSNVRGAIEKSGILNLFPEIDWSKNRVGIFGAPCTLEQSLQQGDRIEIYRPLLQDPKEARRRRAQKSGKRDS